MQLPFVYQVTKYDAADRDAEGRYVGRHSERSDRGPIEAAYLQAVAEFAAERGVDRLSVRNPGLPSFVGFGLDAPIEGHGLTLLFPDDATGFHDGVEVDLRSAQELVRGMLRDSGAWCRLEVEGSLFVHIGYDQYMYIGAATECAGSVAAASRLGLFAERIAASPYTPNLDEIEHRAADRAFWSSLDTEMQNDTSVLLEEQWAANRSRWHRISPANVERVRSGLIPRSRLIVWPDLSDDISTVVAGVHELGLSEIVWQLPTGEIKTRVMDGGFADLPALLSEASAAATHSMDAETAEILLVGVLPDTDGVLRAQWLA